MALERSASGREASSSARSSSRRSSKKVKPEQRPQKSVNAILDEIEGQEFPEVRKQKLLKNLNIRFTKCTFTYKASHFVKESTKKGSSLRSRVFNTLKKATAAISDDHSFDKCLFVPVEEQNQVKNYVLSNFSHVTLSFESCRFIKRSSTIVEKVRRKLRSFFGIQFELEYITATAEVDQYKFRLKDVLGVYQHLQERIAEEG